MNHEFDLVVVGAGINGAGIARDAAMRGLKVLLVDKGDIGSGTSAGSTRLIHGGLRYLEHFEFGLVRESLRERETLLRIAPHLVRPLRIAIPIYRGGGRGWATIRAGMIAYDLLSWGKSLPGHRMLSARETLRQMPGLKAEGLLGSAVYYDAQVEFAERLVLENVLSAVECGATVLTHTRVTDFVIEEGLVAGVRLEGNKTDQFRAPVVINAAGPWVDRLLERMHADERLVTKNETLIGGTELIDGTKLSCGTKLSGGMKLIGGTKGSHLVVAPFAGAPESAVYVEAASDRRPFFIIPWNGNYLIGTTDVRFEGDPDEVRTEAWEIDYLLDETNRAFPSAELSRERVLYTYAGVRPLPFTTNHDERSITRRHFLREHPQFKNLLSIVGGKLTTYRSLAAECVDLVLRKLGREVTWSQTAEVPLPGASDRNSRPDASDRNSLPLASDRNSRPDASDRNSLPLASDRNSRPDACDLNPPSPPWLRIYGSRSKELAELAKHLNCDAFTAEIVFAFQKEFATTLADCFLRRTMIGFNADLGLSHLEAAAEIGKRFLDWSEDRARREVEGYKREISSRLNCGSHGRE